MLRSAGTAALRMTMIVLVIDDGSPIEEPAKGVIDNWSEWFESEFDQDKQDNPGSVPYRSHIVHIVSGEMSALTLI